MDGSLNTHSLLLEALSCCQALEVVHTSPPCCKPLRSVITAASDFLPHQELTRCWLALPFHPFCYPFWVLSQCWFKQLHLKGMRPSESNWPGWLWFGSSRSVAHSVQPGKVSRASDFFAEARLIPSAVQFLPICCISNMFQTRITEKWFILHWPIL